MEIDDAGASERRTRARMKWDHVPGRCPAGSGYANDRLDPCWMEDRTAIVMRKKGRTHFCGRRELGECTFIAGLIQRFVRSSL